jgi:hypothetical protein
MGNLIATLKERQRDYREIEIQLFLLPEDSTMTLDQIKKLTTAELLSLYNELKEAQLKRFADRATAEKRVEEALREKGKLDGPMTNKEAQNIRDTAKAGVNDGTPLRQMKAPKSRAAKPEPAPKGKAAAKPAPGKKSAPTPKSKAGAPTKNQTFTAIDEKLKGYNPKQLRIQSSSARAKVLEFIKKSDAGKTRNQIDAHFPNGDVNVSSALYFLSAYGFVKVVE